MKIRRIGTSLAFAGLLAGTVAIAAPAGADQTYAANGVAIRNQPYTTATRLGLGYFLQNIDINYGVAAGDWVLAYTPYWGNVYSNIWELHHNQNTNVTGWSWRYYLAP